MQTGRSSSSSLNRCRMRHSPPYFDGYMHTAVLEIPGSPRRSFDVWFVNPMSSLLPTSLLHKAFPSRAPCYFHLRLPCRLSVLSNLPHHLDTVPVVRRAVYTSGKPFSNVSSTLLSGTQTTNIDRFGRGTSTIKCCVHNLNPSIRLD